MDSVQHNNELNSLHYHHRHHRGRELVSPPDDAISRVRFSCHSNKLLVSSWDSSVRLYDVDSNKLLSIFAHPSQPIDCCFLDDSSAVAVGSDRSVRRYNLSTKQEEVIGRHESFVSCVEFSLSVGQVITGSWDKSLRFWDVRVPNSGHQTNSMLQSASIKCISVVGHTLVVASGSATITIYDLRRLDPPIHNGESPLRYATACISCYPDASGFAVGSVDGRIALEPFDVSKSSRDGYAFRCIPKSKKSGIITSSVNAIEFHPTDGTFATGDSDGFCILWDGKKRQKSHEYSRYPASIASLSYNVNGTLLAVASSYTCQEYDRTNEQTKLFIENLNGKNVLVS